MKKTLVIGIILFLGASLSNLWANSLNQRRVSVGAFSYDNSFICKALTVVPDTAPPDAGHAVRISDKDAARNARDPLRLFQLGLALGPDLVSISVQNKMDSTSTAKKIEAHSTLGFHVGLALRMNFKRWWYLNTQPQLNFQAANLSYDRQGVQVKTSIAPLTLEIPVHFVFKTYQYKLNPAFFVGVRYIGDLSESTLNKLVNLKKGETALETGVGVEIKFSKRFVFIPSIGAVIGTGNLLQDGLGSIGNAVESIKRTKIELHFVFF